MAVDAKKHTSFAAGETPRRQVAGGAGLADALLSINDPVPVASATEQAQIVTALSTTSYPVGPTRPLTTVRADARGLHQIEVTRDGSVFVPVSGVLTFTSLTLANTFAASYSALLSVNDHAIIAGLDYVWDGTAWAARQSAWTAVPAYDGTWSVAGAYGYRALSVRRSGELVKMEGTIARSTGTIADGYVGAVVPAGFRPAARVWVPNGFSPLTASARNVEIVVETDGSVKFGLAGQPDIPTNQVVNVSGVWFS